MVLLSLVPVGILALQAYEATRSQQATAENVLEDYAAMAAREFNSRLDLTLGYDVLYPAIAAINSAKVMRSMPRRMALCPMQDPKNHLAFRLVRSFFKYDRNTEELSMGEVGYSDEDCCWLEEAVCGHACPSDQDSYFRFFLEETESDECRAIVCFTDRDKDADPRYLYGFEVVWDELLQTFEDILADPLLPEQLTERVDVDEGLVVSLSTDSGNVVFQSGEMADEMRTASQPLGPSISGLTVEVALPTDMAEQLVIGGLPASRFPAIVTLLATSIGLVVGAYLLLRREQDLARVRSEFVANVSHDLRTPLAQIRLFAETLLLRRVRSPQEERRCLEVIDKEVRRLTHQVDNVLHFSRTENRALPLKLREVDLPDLVREVLSDYRPLVESRDMRVRVVLPEVPRIEVDEEAFQRVLLNLLDNAVKYGPDGQTITVSLTGEEDAIRLCVQDEGPGVPRKERDRIWDRYGRARSEQNQSVAGTGIGLFLVRNLVQMHGGRTWVTAGRHGGSRFCAEFPVARRLRESSVGKISSTVRSEGTA